MRLFTLDSLPVGLHVTVTFPFTRLLQLHDTARVPLRCHTFGLLDLIPFLHHVRCADPHVPHDFLRLRLLDSFTTHHADFDLDYTTLFRLILVLLRTFTHGYVVSYVTDYVLRWLRYALRSHTLVVLCRTFVRFDCYVGLPPHLVTTAVVRLHGCTFSQLFAFTLFTRLRIGYVYS